MADPFRYNFDVTPYEGDLSTYGSRPGHQWFDYYGPSSTGPTEPGTGGSNRLSIDEWRERDPIWRQAHPDLAPEGYEDDFNPASGPTGSDRGDNARGLGRDQAEAKSLGEFARASMMGLGVFGGLPGMLGLGASIGTGKPTGIMDLLGIDLFGNEPSFSDDIVSANTSANTDSTRSDDDPDGIGIGGGGQSAGGYSGGGNADAWGGTGEKMANGGLKRKSGLPPPRLMRGKGDGRSDSIEAYANGGVKPRLSTGEFVWPADVVSATGRGSTEAGARKLGMAAQMIRQQHMNRMGALPPPGMR